MDLLPHPRPDSIGVGPLEVPCVADTPYSGSDFWDFPQTHGFGSRWITLPAPRLASLAQSWLFFGTISEFLGRQIDYREFKSFRRGFAFDDRGHPDWSNVTLKPLIPMLEEWLEKSKQGSEAVRKYPVSFWKRHLRSMIPVRTSRLDDSSKLPGDSDLHQLAGFLDKVFDLADDFEQLSQGHVYPIPVIILSVKVLCITLSGLIREKYQLDNGNRPPMSWPGTLFRGPGTTIEASCLPTSQLLADVFQQHGWCPFLVGKLMFTHNYAVVYYFTRLYRRFSADLSHRGCSEMECVASNIHHLDAYGASHAEPNCRCRHLSVQADHIRKIIKEGGIPLVRFDASTRRKSSIKVVRMTPWITSFVAFSHVWRDTGLGNSRANSLPKCQLSKLQGWADSTEIQALSRTSNRKQSRHLYFWIDTLCIPAGNSTDEARMQAINKIPVVFQAAERVAVLDKSLLEMSLKSTEPCELTARLSASPWSSRCWPYLEASLGSPSLEVQCADGTFVPCLWDDDQGQIADLAPHKSSMASITRVTTTKGEILRERPPPNDFLLQTKSFNDGPTAFKATEALVTNTLLRPLRRDLQSPFKTKLVTRRRAGTVTVECPDLCTTFIHAWNELSKRTTTLPEDKQIILATLLGFNTQPIQRIVDPKERMATILGNMDGLPLSLFLSLTVSSQTMTENGSNKWMPPYPSPRTRLVSIKTPQYTNIRSDNLTGDLYFPNNRISRRVVSTLIIPLPEGSLSPNSVGQFRIWDRSGDRKTMYTVKAANQGVAESRTDGSHAYCLLFRRISALHQSSKEEFDMEETGSLFRIKTINQRELDPDTKTEEPVYGQTTSSSSVWKSTSSFGLAGSHQPSPAGVQLEFSRGGSISHSNMESLGISDLSVLLSEQYQYYGPSMAVRVAYECPVTVTPYAEDTPFNFGFSPDPEGQDNRETSELFAATPLPPNWQMVLELDGPRPPQLTSHLPSYEASMAIPPISTTFFLTALDGLVAAGSVSMSLAICFTLIPLHILSPLSSIPVVLNLVLYSVSIIQLLLFDDDGSAQQTHHGKSIISAVRNKASLYDSLHLVIVAVYTLSRAISTGGGSKLNILDKSFIYWSFLGHTVNILTRVLMTRFFVMPRIWGQYLASFDDGSEAKNVTDVPPPQSENLEKWKGGIGVSSRPCGEISDDEELASELLVPPWESRSREHANSYGDLNSHHGSETTYPYPMEVSDNYNKPTSHGNGGTAGKGGLGTLLMPLWANLGKFTIPKFMKRAGEHHSSLLRTSPTVNTDNAMDKPRAFRWVIDRTWKQKGKQRQRRGKLRTESMVVEAPSTAAWSEYWDRTSWRSGDYLLGEAR